MVQTIFNPLGVPIQLTDFTSSHMFWLNTLKGSTLPLMKAILDFSTLRGTKPQILTTNRYDVLLLKKNTKYFHCLIDVKFRNFVSEKVGRYNSTIMYIFF